MRRLHTLRGFVNNELLVVIAWLAIGIAIALPIIERMRAGRLSTGLGVFSLLLVTLVFVAPWLYVWWSDRRGGGTFDRKNHNDGT